MTELSFSRLISYSGCFSRLWRSGGRNWKGRGFRGKIERHGLPSALWGSPRYMRVFGNVWVLFSSRLLFELGDKAPLVSLLPHMRPCLVFFPIIIEQLSMLPDELLMFVNQRLLASKTHTSRALSADLASATKTWQAKSGHCRKIQSIARPVPERRPEKP